MQVHIIHGVTTYLSTIKTMQKKYELVSVCVLMQLVQNNTNTVLHNMYAVTVGYHVLGFIHSVLAT